MVWIASYLEHGLGLLPDLVVLIRCGSPDDRLDEVVFVKLTQALGGREGEGGQFGFMGQSGLI